MKKNKKRQKDKTGNPFNHDYFSYKNDYPIEEVWNTNNALAQLIVPRLLAFKELDKHGCPPDFDDMRKWNNTIQKMVDAFVLMKVCTQFIRRRANDSRERLVTLL